MGNPVFGAFTLLIVVNGQDVQITCSLCGIVRDSTVDRSAATEAAVTLHTESHIRAIAGGDRWVAPVEPGGQRETDR